MTPRVLMVVGAYYPELAGGSLQCRTLVGALRSRVRFSVLTTATQAPDAAAEVDGVPVHRVFVDARAPLTKVGAAVDLLRLLPRLVREHDIFHFHGFTEKMLPLLGAARVRGRRTIDKITSLGWDDPIAIRDRPRGGLLAAGLTRVDRLVAVTPAIHDRCREAGVPEDRIADIPNGVDIDRFAPVDEAARGVLRARLGLPADRPIVAFVGFWSRDKGPERLFDAWLEARRRSGVPAALLYIGRTDAAHAEVDRTLVADVRRRIAEHALEREVFFVEQTNDVAGYLQACDVFAVPTAREGLSNALLESMAAGVPSITGAIPGVSDAVVEHGVTGFIVAPRDVDGLAAVLERLLTRPELRADIGRRARARIVDRFAIGRTADRYYALYSELLTVPC